MGPLEFLLVGLYFGLMAVLSLFGLHRYSLVYLYYRNRRHVQGPPIERLDPLPRVTVQLPIFNEQFVVAGLLRSVAALHYPRHLLQVQVLDDSTDETSSILRRLVQELHSCGLPIEYRHRRRRLGFKAGALDEGLRHATGDLIAVFDADFTPESDFLLRVVHYFADARVGMVQARWTFRNRSQSLLTRAQAMLLDGHFVFEHGARSRSGLFFNFNGTAGVLRKTAIEDAGGWQHDTLTEDSDLSYRAQLRGWKFLYVPHVRAPSELPTEMASFQVQQFRWAKGLVQTGLKLLPSVWRSGHPRKVKVEATAHLMANLAYPLMLVLAVLILPSMLVRHTELDGRLLWLDLPAFVMTFCSLSSFYTLAQRELDRGAPWRHAPMIPLIVSAGIGLAISNSRAVLGALLGHRSPFERTAKYSGDRNTAVRARSVYGRQGGWRMVANLLAAAYFTACLVIAIGIGHWMGIPVILLFLAGFVHAGALMFAERRTPGRSLCAEAARSG